MSEVEKLSKKQKKALGFRKSKEEREVEKQEKQQKRKLEDETPEATATQPSTTEEGGESPAPKKRKTRRGKKGKGVNEGRGPRFIVFVGNLPYDITQVELVSHFKNSNPDRIRIRQDKGIAFLEFDNDTQEIQSKMELALRMHHSLLRNRKINVELTVGGGGNSENRIQKIKEKNEKMLEGRKKMDEVKKTKKAEGKKVDNKKSEGGDDDSSAPVGRPSGIHPSRMKLLS
ncbi:NOP6 [[Candida] subhashii]|uniref:NOP6 n=1 Tax=[Candida] subhashii TaxID=561895 RepID=A0A8J5QQ05_9ASCO|nr:NOP6 [[Candida] subhashii]KAG7664485.1 NOP6 [[Candida] subhashii]